MANQQITVKDNLLKLLGKTFLHLQPIRQGELHMGEAYEVTTEYGHTGTATIIAMYTTPLYDLKSAACLLATGQADIREAFKSEGNYYSDDIQHAILKFSRRTETAFNTLLPAELKKAAIAFTRQPVLF